VHRQGTLFHLDIVGNSPASAVDFQKSFEENHIGDTVSFHGWLNQKEIQQLLNTSDLLLLTSNSEGMPLVMMEALASGCGFTGTRVSGIEDYENDPRSQACLSVYTVGDIEDAVKKISRVAAVPKPLRQKAARALAESEFSMQVCLANYDKAIDTVVSAPVRQKSIKSGLSDLIYSKAISLARYIKISIAGK